MSLCFWIALMDLGRAIRTRLHQGDSSIRAQDWCGYVIDVDIRKYFDTIPHDKLREMIREKVQDSAMTRLISKWLTAGVMEEGKVSLSDVGSPQGGVISPLLSNIYLHYALDSWIYETVRGYCEEEIELFRYADDFLIICKSLKDANKIFRVLGKRAG